MKSLKINKKRIKKLYLLPAEMENIQLKNIDLPNLNDNQLY